MSEGKFIDIQSYIDPPTADSFTREHTAKDIAATATRKRQWVFDPSTKHWYSPEEFLEKFGRIHVGIEKFLNQVQVRNPFDGIQAANKRILDIQIKLQDFTKRVVEYYRK